MEPVERLRRLTVNGERIMEDACATRALDRRTLALARIAALIAIGGAGPSFGAEIDTAIAEGATDQEIIDVLAGIVPLVGMARVVAAAPMMALALGYDDLFEPS